MTMASLAYLGFAVYSPAIEFGPLESPPSIWRTWFSTPPAITRDWGTCPRVGKRKIENANDLWGFKLDGMKVSEYV